MKADMNEPVHHVVDALIVGGGPGGMSTAITAAKVWPGRKIFLVRKEDEPVVPCGIPYIFGTLGGVEADLMSNAPFRALGGSVLSDPVVQIDRQARRAVLASGDVVEWQRLVLATGTLPHLPDLPGIRRPGVFVIRKDYDYLEHLFDELLPTVERLVIVGGGFIGVEFADEIRKRGVQVTLLEQLPHLLLRNFDAAVSTAVEKKMQQAGIEIQCGVQVVALEGEGDEGPVQGVRLADDHQVPADAVLIAFGDQRNTALAESLGLTMARGGGIWVDAFQRSREDSCIFAVGDCAFKQDILLRRSIPSLLASTAAAEGRTAGMNLFGLRNERFNAGSIAIYASQIGDLAFGCAGMTAQAARQEGFAVVVGRVEVPDHHPPTMPGTRLMTCELIFSGSGLLLGGQIMGGTTSAEVLNAIGIAIQARLTVHDLVGFQFGSHPRLTAPAHPIALAALEALFVLQATPSASWEYGAQS